MGNNNRKIVISGNRVKEQKLHKDSSVYPLNTPKNMDDRCPDCRMSWWLFPPARCDERKADGSFGPGPFVRCIDCKRVYLRPIQEGVKEK